MTRVSTSFSYEEVKLLDEVLRPLLRGGDVPAGVLKSPLLASLTSRVAELRRHAGPSEGCEP